MNINSNHRKNLGKQRDSLKKWNQLMLPIPNTPNKKSKTNSQNEGNYSNITAIAGNWIGAVGTIISAIGSTPSTIFTNQTLEDFNIIGNILEAFGSAIVADTEDVLLDKVGGQISAIGNLEVVAGILAENEQLGQMLEKQGDLLQIVGVGITIQTQGKLTLKETISNTGNIIQLIGNVIQVFANTETEEGQRVGAAGAWIQAVGAVTTALGSD